MFKSMKVAVITGVAIGITAMATMGMCTPDTTPVTDTPSTSTIVDCSVFESTSNPTLSADTIPGVCTESDGSLSYATYTLIPCPTEDSENCYWVAQTMGNGNGTSFVNLDGTIYYPKGN